MDADTKHKVYGAAAVVAIVIALSLIPADYQVGSIPSGRFLSPATLVAIDESQDALVVRLDSASHATETYLVLQGKHLDSCFEGQKMEIGYTKQGLYEDTSQTVATAYQIHGNLFGSLINAVAPFQVAYDMKIVDYASDGTELTYFRKS